MTEKNGSIGVCTGLDGRLMISFDDFKPKGRLLH